MVVWKDINFLGDAYRASLTTYSKEIRNAKRDNFRKFCVDVSSTPAVLRLHKALFKGAVETNLSIWEPDGTYIASLEGKTKPGTRFKTHVETARGFHNCKSH